MFSSALCSDVHSLHFSICSRLTVCSVQHCALMHTAVKSIFALDRPCDNCSNVLWCTQPSLQYFFWTDRLFSSALCSDAHSLQFYICSGQTLWSIQHCALIYTASLKYLFWTDRVLSSSLCFDVHSRHLIICSGLTVCSVQHCALLYTSITSLFVLDRPCVQFSPVL